MAGNEMTCARCGKEIGITEFVKNTLDFKILGLIYLLRFCNLCRNIIKEGLEDAVYKK